MANYSHAADNILQNLSPLTAFLKLTSLGFTASFPGWGAQTGGPWWGHGCECSSARGGCSFLPAQPGRAVWGCPRPPGSGVGKPPGLQSNLKPDSARALGQLAVGLSHLCGYQEACLCAVPWPAVPASAGMAPADGCLPASLEQPSRLLLVA